MAEIKSTLDLIMEKTKHLTLTQEEKEKQTFEEFRKKLNGLLKKFEEGIYTNIEFDSELKELQKHYEITEKKIVIRAIADEINLDQDNTLLLTLLKNTYGSDVNPIQSVLDHYQTAIYQITQERIQQIKKNMAREHSISGSAVVPDLEEDAVWLEANQTIRSNFDQLLSQAKAKLK
ncbi:MAG: hypothetical protein JW786_06455 [Desulfobacterales bacterium]|nr:hypothetical protein [Desulfobacterales bacterium]